MRKFINYIRSCFCKHNFELIRDTDVYFSENDKMPMYNKKVFMCTKCYYFKKIKC